MSTLPDHLERIGTDLDLAARTVTAQRRRRARRIQVVALVAATAALGTGVALAASGFDILPWLREDDPTEARYLADTTRTYEGAAPQEVECETVRGASFTCRALPPGPWECPSIGPRAPYPCGDPAPSQRIYTSHGRVEATPKITRELLLGVIDDARAEGMSPTLEAKFRDAFEDVSDDFIARLDLLTRIQGGRTYHSDEQGRTIAPPSGVPISITCEGPRGAKTMTCRDIAGATDVPVGAPVYGLMPTDDWVRHEPKGSPAEQAAFVESFFGRPLSWEETLVLVWMGLGGDMTAAEWAQVERALERAEAAYEKQRSERSDG